MNKIYNVWKEAFKTIDNPSRKDIGLRGVLEWFHPSIVYKGLFQNIK
jgi:hypothetical protein